MAFTMRLDELRDQRLDDRAAAEGRKKADIVREAIDQYLDREDRQTQIMRSVDETLKRYPETMRRLAE